MSSLCFIVNILFVICETLWFCVSSLSKQKVFSNQHKQLCLLVGPKTMFKQLTSYWNHGKRCPGHNTHRRINGFLGTIMAEHCLVRALPKQMVWISVTTIQSAATMPSQGQRVHVCSITPLWWMRHRSASNTTSKISLCSGHTLLYFSWDKNSHAKNWPSICGRMV